MKRYVVILISLFFVVAACQCRAQTEPFVSRRLILVHYMPWFQAKPMRDQWGWHWCMGQYDPERQFDGKREIASHLYPLIGPYDSADPAVLEYHLLLMKIAGIDGVIVDWYGLRDLHDYRVIHENTQKLLSSVSQLGMQFAICYEDQVVAKLIDAGKLDQRDQVSHVVKEIGWLQKHWFATDAYVSHEGRPVLLSFGHEGLDAVQWAQCLSQLEIPIAYFSQQTRPGATGVFDWPLPSKGLKANRNFNQQMVQSDSANSAIPVAFPRYRDIYSEAGVQNSFGRIADQQGRTFQKTFDEALDLESFLIQIATWNDWGEGTVIEPSREFGYRDLEYIQQQRRVALGASFVSQPKDLRLPYRLYQLRSMPVGKTDAGQARLNQIAAWLAQGKTEFARTELAALENED